jgi:ATP-dependent Zn protease
VCIPLVGASSGTRDLTYSEFISAIKSGTVESVEIAGNSITGTFATDDGGHFRTYAPAVTKELLELLGAHGVTVVALPQAAPWRLPLFLLVGLCLVVTLILAQLSGRVRRVEELLRELSSQIGGPRGS